MTVESTEQRADIAVRIRPLQPEDLDVADRIMRVAFGTFVGLPDPGAFMGDADLVHTRAKAAPSAAFAAEAGGELIGSNFAANWGSVGFFGPLTIRPDLWDRGVGKRLMEPVMECFERWGTRHAGLFTFPHSPKHVGLYQRFGFWPGFLTAVMSKPVEKTPPVSWSKFSDLSEPEPALTGCRRLTNAIYDGLDVTREILAVAGQGLGDTVLVSDDSGPLAVAVCHTGPGTEAGSDACYVKFGAVRPGSHAESGFGHLLDACEAFASERGALRLIAGVSTGRLDAYRMMLSRGFRTDFQGVAMHRSNAPGYDRRDAFVLEDWR